MSRASCSREREATASFSPIHPPDGGARLGSVLAACWSVVGQRFEEGREGGQQSLKKQARPALESEPTCAGGVVSSTLLF